MMYHLQKEKQNVSDELVALWIFLWHREATFEGSKKPFHFMDVGLQATESPLKSHGITAAKLAVPDAKIIETWRQKRRNGKSRGS